MRRRDFLVGFTGTAAATFAASGHARSANEVRRVAFLSGASMQLGTPYLAAFRKRLLELGWAEGHNLRIDARFADGNVSRARVYAAELVGLAPDVILAQTTLGLDAVRPQTKTIPVVFTSVSDPVGGGYVTNLARPEGNITGFTNFEYGMSVKWLELLHELAPQVNRITVLVDVTSSGEGHLRSLEATTPPAISLVPTRVTTPQDIERAFGALPTDGKQGVIVLPGSVPGVNRKLIVDRMAQLRVPAVYAYRYFVDLGGLISYGFDVTEHMRQAAGYVDRILRGAKPRDLPVQAPTKFELVINMKAAKALGLTVPAALLVEADDVIE
jgi:putative ABC transport system substrate-binding protein